VAARVFRHRTNWVAAPGIQLILAGLWILNDPLQLRGPLPPVEALTSAQAVIVPLAMGLVGVGAMAFGWYPRVEVTDEAVLIRNPLRDVHIRGRIDDVDLSARHVRLQAGGKWYRCWGAETSLSMRLWRQKRSSSALLAASLVGHRLQDSSDVTQRWRTPTVVESIVITFWLGLVIFSAVHGVNS
jgi:hypothetical protein